MCVGCCYLCKKCCGCGDDGNNRTVTQRETVIIQQPVSSQQYPGQPMYDPNQGQQWQQQPQYYPQQQQQFAYPPQQGQASYYPGQQQVMQVYPPQYPPTANQYPSAPGFDIPPQQQPGYAPSYPYPGYPPK